MAVVVSLLPSDSTKSNHDVVSIKHDLLYDTSRRFFQRVSYCAAEIDSTLVGLSLCRFAQHDSELCGCDISVVACLLAVAAFRLMLL